MKIISFHFYFPVFICESGVLGVKGFIIIGTSYSSYSVTFSQGLIFYDTNISVSSFP